MSSERYFQPSQKLGITFIPKNSYFNNYSHWSNFMWSMNINAFYIMPRAANFIIKLLLYPFNSYPWFLRCHNESNVDHSQIRGSILKYGNGIDLLSYSYNCTCILHWTMTPLIKYMHGGKDSNPRWAFAYSFGDCPLRPLEHLRIRKSSKFASYGLEKPRLGWLRGLHYHFGFTSCCVAPYELSRYSTPFTKLWGGFPATW